MSDLVTLIANIQSQALVGNTGADGDIQRILRYVNKAYTKIYGKEAQVYPDLFLKYQNVPIVNGVGVFPDKPYIVLDGVRDVGNNYRILCPLSLSDRELNDPQLVSAGFPSSYSLTFGGISTYPLSTTTLRVPYIPNPNVLTISSLESDIQIPPVYHEVLEWETLWTIAYDERDKLVGQEMQYTQNRRDELMSSMVQYLQIQRPRTLIRRAQTL